VPDCDWRAEPDAETPDVGILFCRKSYLTTALMAIPTFSRGHVEVFFRTISKRSARRQSFSPGTPVSVKLRISFASHAA
jgi:hypothetical protein